MDNQISFADIRPYILRNARIVLFDGRIVVGMVNISPSSLTEVVVDGEAYPLEEIQNIEFVGKITEFDADKGLGKIEGCIFDMDDIVDEESAEIIIYGEYKCTAACRLSLATGKIEADDVRVLEHERVFDDAEILDEEMIYLFKDGSSFVGTLADDMGLKQLVSVDGTEKIYNQDEIENVIRIPELNERIRASLKDGRTVEGLVANAAGGRLVLVGENENLDVLELGDVEAVRYRGQVVKAGEVKTPSKGESFRIVSEETTKIISYECRKYYFENTAEYDLLKKGTEVSYVHGIGRNGYIAKNIVLENRTAEVLPDGETETGRGIVLFMPNSQTPGSVGYIGPEYVSKAYCAFNDYDMPRGSVSFSRDALKFEPAPGRIFLVEYECTVSGEEERQSRTAFSVKLIQDFPYAESARITLDEDGNAVVTPFSVSLLERFEHREVELTMKSGLVMMGMLESVSADEIRFVDRNNRIATTETIKKNDIAKVRFYGKITAYRQDNGTGYVDGEYWFHINSLLDYADAPNIRIGNRILFGMEQTNKGKYCAAYELSAPQIGYIVKYVSMQAGISFGFIVDPEDLEASLASEDRKGKIYFRSSDIVNPDEFMLNTYSYYYEVTYSRDRDDVAKNVKIIRRHEIAATVSESGPAQSAEYVVEQLPESVELSEYMEGAEEAFGDAYWEFGLINMCGSFYGIINKGYINTKYEKEIDPQMLGERVAFDPARVNFLGSDGLKTNKTSYLVRYVQKGTAINPKTGEEELTIDYDYPIQVLRAVNKKWCKSISISDGVLHIDTAQVASPVIKGDVEREYSFELPEIMSGENIIFQKNDRSMEAYEIERFDEERECFIAVDGTMLLEKDITRYYRFGIVTDFNMEKGIASINNMFEVHLEIIDAKAINIVKNQLNGVRLHVLYGVENDEPVEVIRITAEFTSLFMWDRVVVTGSDAVRKAITVEKEDHEANHYISVLSDGAINKSIKSNLLIGRDVYARICAHPMSEEIGSQPELALSAFDLRMVEEMAMIQYDAGRNIYMGYRNPTFYYPVLGKLTSLAKVNGQNAAVVFVINEDGFSLSAYLKSDAEDEDTEVVYEEIDNASIDTIFSERLVRFLMSRVNLREKNLKEIELGEDGMPVDEEQIKKAVDILMRHNGAFSKIDAATVAERYPEIFEKLDDGSKGGKKYDARRMMLMGLADMCYKIGKNLNFVAGEHAYYISVMLRCSTESSQITKYLYLLFLQDFGTPEERVSFVKSNKKCDQSVFETLFKNNCRKMSEFISHLMLLESASIERVCDLLHQNSFLERRVAEAITQIDDSVGNDRLAEMVESLRRLYQDDKRRFSEEITSLLSRSSISSVLLEQLKYMQVRFLKLVTDDDENYFETLTSICLKLNGYTDHPGFSAQEEVLRTAYTDLLLLLKTINDRPCKEAVEILLLCTDRNSGKNVIQKLIDETAGLISELYSNQESIPQITCMPNESILSPGQTTFNLIVTNGDLNQKLQSAENIVLNLESYSEGVSVGIKYEDLNELKRHRLAAGDQVSVEVSIESEEKTDEKITIGWSVGFDYIGSFEGGNPVSRHMDIDNGSTFDLQYGTQMVLDLSRSYNNPYADAADGIVLEDDTMFFGRETEIADIKSAIIATDDDGTERFALGKPVIIHGQKKSGKSSLVYQIKNYIASSESLSESAIIINFDNFLDDIGGAEILSFFKRSFYTRILVRFDEEMMDKHFDVYKEMLKNDLTIPSIDEPEYDETWPTAFSKFFEKFKQMDKGRHTVVLIMDEFTLLCTTIMKEIEMHPENETLSQIPNFIKTFAKLGFVQIIIGHEAMKRALNKLNVWNHTMEFSEAIEVVALDEEASKQLVIKPMMEALGFDPYDTKLGAKAIERLLDLSGRNATYLMRLCNRMFNYFVGGKCRHSRILETDVNDMIREYISELSLDDFDILLNEDGDALGSFENRLTYKYLKRTAILAKRSTDCRTADIGKIASDLTELENIDSQVVESTRTLLEGRRVISITTGGRVRINTGLFIEFIWQREGGK